MTGEEYYHQHLRTMDFIRKMNPNPSEEVLAIWKMQDANAKIYANWLKSKEAKEEPDDDFNIVINPIVKVKK